MLKRLVTRLLRTEQPLRTPALLRVRLRAASASLSPRARLKSLMAVGWVCVSALSPVFAQAQTNAERVQPEVIAEGLEHAWALGFLPGGRFLVTERVGRLRIVEADGRIGPPLAGLPRIDVGGQGGLLDLALDSNFERNRTLFLCFTEPGEGGNSTAMARAELSADERTLNHFRVIFSQQPKLPGRHHFGCRIVEHSDGTLMLTLGERFNRMNDAQRLDNHLGKLVRVHKDGRVPADNPYVGHAQARPEIFSIGHRNPQGATLDSRGRLWVHEHGPQGGDEINLPQPGKNYGWPVITYGEQYGGGKIGAGITHAPGLEQPIHHWTPSIAPSGMTFLTSNRYGDDWRGSLFVGSVKFGFLTRMVVSDTRVIREERLLQSLGQWTRDVRQGPDGLVYVLTDAPNGRLIRLNPVRQP